jgi:hypothetical protein
VLSTETSTKTSAESVAAATGAGKRRHQQVIVAVKEEVVSFLFEYIYQAARIAVRKTSKQHAEGGDPSCGWRSLFIPYASSRAEESVVIFTLFV